MEDGIAPDIIKATQVSLGKYVKRPPLSDKLLKKPPFRFLHDIVTSVLKSTGFFRGLFGDEELISDNVKDRESKILFLTKVISVVGTTTGKTLNVKPSKIVAGQEPEKTNELLQCLALALDKKVSSDDAVKLFKESSNLTANTKTEKKVRDAVKPVKKQTDTKKLTSKSTEKLVKSDRNPSKTRQRENSTLKKEPSLKAASQASKIINKKGIDKEKQENKSIKSLNTINNLKVVSKAEPIQNIVDTDSNIPQDSVDPDSNIDVPNLEISQESNDFVLLKSGLKDTIEGDGDIRNAVQKNSPISQENVNAPIDNEYCEISRTESAKVEENEHISNKNETEIINNDLNTNIASESSLVTSNGNNQKQDNVTTSHMESEIKVTETKVVDVPNLKRPNSVRPSSSRPGAPRFRDKHESLLSTVDNLVVGKVNIIAENTTQEEEEENSIVIVDNSDTLTSSDDQMQISSNQHGHLVQQILNAQKEFSETNGKTNVEWQFGSHKARDIVNQEIEQLRFNVQALSRVANPLGKLLDHIQEDVEVMRQELQQWTKSYEDASKQLLKQKAANEESLFPLHTKLKQLEADIMEKHDKINDLKIVIHKNAFRIEKLLASGNVQ